MYTLKQLQLTMPAVSSQTGLYAVVGTVLVISAVLAAVALWKMVTDNAASTTTSTGNYGAIRKVKKAVLAGDSLPPVQTLANGSLLFNVPVTFLGGLTTSSMTAEQVVGSYEYEDMSGQTRQGLVIDGDVRFSGLLGVNTDQINPNTSISSANGRQAQDSMRIYGDAACTYARVTGMGGSIQGPAPSSSATVPVTFPFLNTPIC